MNFTKPETIKKIIIATLVGIAVILGLFAASSVQTKQTKTPADTAAEEAESSGKVMILYTSDIHCGIDKGFGLAGLYAVREKLESDGYETILVDDGDAIQGESIGMMTKGEAIIDLMNSMHYDVAIPGNHEFDYSCDRLIELSEKAEFPYISCNIRKNGELVFEPYVIKEAGGMKIAFVGITTPTTLTSSTPKYFNDEDGNRIYSFSGGEKGTELYKAVQDAVDAARAEGADYVYVMAHLGMDAADAPYTYADVLENTNGIDVLLDGHSHDTEQVVMKNKDGKEVVRTACGTKLQAIGYSELSAEEGIIETNIWSWSNSVSAPELLGIENEISEEIDTKMSELGETLNEVVGKSDFNLTIYDPKEKNADGSPVRMVRRGETNLADFCADAIRVVMDADIGIVNGGGVRVDIAKGDITYEDIINVFPFNNEMMVVEATGQEILDALEWGARALPAEDGGILHVSGLTYEIDVNIPSSCTSDDDGMFTGVSGERRVKNVMFDGKPIDPNATYTVAATNYVLKEHGDGRTAFDDSPIIEKNGKLDNEVLIDYIKDYLGGEVGSEYADPYGDGRLTIIQ